MYTTVSPRARIASLLAAAAVQLGLAAALLWGLSWGFGASDPPAPSLVSITAKQVPSEEQPQPQREKGAAAPPDREAEAAPVRAPPVEIVLSVPVPAASEAETEDDQASGAARLPGPGNGAGGSGSGSGSGAGGAGKGSGAVSAPVRIAGGISDRDYPRGANGAAGTVAIEFTVMADGRVDSCGILVSSGYPALDRLTCQLAEQRFRYRPARDPAGRPVAAVQRTTFTWGLRPR